MPVVTYLEAISQALREEMRRDSNVFLDAPVRRVGALDVPIPFSPPLEDAVLPIETEARKLLVY